jgi:hypothetical protein
VCGSWSKSRTSVRSNTRPSRRRGRRNKLRNPRLYDGDILSVVRMDPGREILCRRGRYRHLTVEPEIETGTDQLSVTAVVLSRDNRGDDTVLLGRRGRETRIYAACGSWVPPVGSIRQLPLHTSLGETELGDCVLREVARRVGRPRRRPAPPNLCHHA